MWRNRGARADRVNRDERGSRPTHPQEPSGPRPYTSSGPGFVWRPTSILFVDPDRASSERLAQIVTPGWAVALAGSRREAWALIKIHVPDLVVTELDLADASGLDFVRELRAHPETRSTLLLVLTTRRSQHDKIACLLSGADAYLVKPVSPSQFDLQVKLLTRFYQVVEELPSHYGGSGETR